MVTSEEDCASDGYPCHPGRNTSKERSRSLLTSHLAKDLPNRHALLGQHHPRLEHIQGRRQRRRDRTRQTAVQGALTARDLLAAPATPAPRLHGLPQRELDDGKGHLAEDRDAPAAVHLAPHPPEAMRRVPAQDRLEGRLARAPVQARLRALLDHLGRHAHRARRNLARAGGNHVRERSVEAFVREPLPHGLLGRLVGAEKEGRARGRPDNRGADAAVDAREAARGEEAGRRLQTGLERIEGEEREIDGRSGEGAGEEGGLEGGVLRRHCFGGLSIEGFVGIGRE